MSNYNVKTTIRSATPRSKRLRNGGMALGENAIIANSLSIFEQSQSPILNCLGIDENGDLFVKEKINEDGGLVPRNFYAFGAVAAGGVGSGGGGGGDVFTTVAYANIGSQASEDMSKVPTAWAAKTLQDRIAALESAPAGGVTSFNTRTGAVTLASSDVVNALGYTPVNKAGDTMAGSLELFATGSAWNEGIRMHVASNYWVGIVMCGSDNAGSTGTSERTWSIHNYDGHAYFVNNGSSSYTYGFDWTNGGALTMKASSMAFNVRPTVNGTNVALTTDLNSYQPLATAINTGNIGSQSVANATLHDGYTITQTNGLTDTRRDYPDGTLVRTSIDYSASNGAPFYMEIKGNAYGNGICFTQVQGYIYSDSIINCGATHLGVVKITPITAMNLDGYLCFWFPRLGYWHGYDIRCYTGWNYAINLVTSIENSRDPIGTKRVVITNYNEVTTINSSNYTDYCVSPSSLDNYLPLGGGKMTGRLDLPTDTVSINFRGFTSSSWDSWLAHESSGNEALVFGTQNAATAIMFINGESYENVSSSRFQSLTPALSIVQNNVLIGYSYQTLPVHKLAVNGSFNATTIYQNGVALGARAFDNTAYLPLSGGTLSGYDNVLSLYSTSSNAWIYFKINGTGKASAGYYAGLASIANETTLARIGVTDSGVPQYWDNAAGGTGHQFDIYHSGNLTKSTLGLGNVDNTADANKSVANAAYLAKNAGTSTMSVNISSWDGAISEGAAIWREAFKDTAISSDTGDLVFKLRASQWSSGGTELCLCIDGDYYAMGYKVWNAGNSNNTSTPWSAQYLNSSNIKIECNNSGGDYSNRSSEINNYNSHLYLQHHSSNNLLLCHGGGNVGVGTLSPVRKLEISSAGSIPLRLNNTGGNAGIEILTASDKHSWLLGAQFNVDNGFEITPSTAVGGTSFTTPALVIKANGNVGIGATSPSAKLDVRGQTVIRKDLGGNISNWETLQHNGPLEVGRTTNSMCVAIGVSDDNVGYIQTKGFGLTSAGNLVLNPEAGSHTGIQGLNLNYTFNVQGSFHALTGYINDQPIVTQDYLSTNYQPKLVVGVNLRTINGQSILGAGISDIDARAIPKATEIPDEGLHPDTFYDLGYVNGDIWANEVSGAGFGMVPIYHIQFRTGSLVSLDHPISLLLPGAWEYAVGYERLDSGVLCEPDVLYQVTIIDGLVSYLKYQV